MKARTNYGPMDLAVDNKTGRAKAMKPAAGHAVPAKVSAAAPASSPRYRSKLEAAFACKLELGRRAFALVRWWHEPFSLRLAAKTFYRPDFLVQSGETLTIYEVKGFRRDDAMVKLKVAARLFPCFRFVLVEREKGQWIETAIAAA